MDACRYSKKYQGLRAPKCNNGDPCDLCSLKYNLQTISDILNRPKFDLKDKEMAEVELLFWYLRAGTFDSETACNKAAGR
jgi:hypothetical protein